MSTALLAAPRALRRFVLDHDDSRAFVFVYVGLALVLSVWISLFWLVAVVSVHAALEWAKQSHLRATARSAAAATLWELKLDLALVLFALALSLYMDVVLGLAGLGPAARVGAAAARGGARVAAWQKAVRGILLSLDDAAQAVRAFAARRRRPPGAAASVPDAADHPAAAGHADRPWIRPWSAGARFSLGFGAVCLLLLLLAPWLTGHGVAGALAVLAEELRPFPGDRSP
jgi:hypothetical protein